MLTRTILIVFAVVLMAMPACAQTADEANCEGGNTNLAISGCTAAINSGQLDNEDLATLFNDRGVAYVTKRLYDQALADYSQSIALNPNYALAYRNRAVAYFSKGEAGPGLRDADTAVALAPTDAAGLLVRAEIYENLHRRAEAASDFRAVLRLDPANQSAAEGLRRAGISPLVRASLGVFVCVLLVPFLGYQIILAFNNLGTGQLRVVSKSLALALVINRADTPVAYWAMLALTAGCVIPSFSYLLLISIPFWFLR